MFDGSWKTWVLIAALIGGGAVEVLKRMPQDEASSWKNENMHLADEQPYSVSSDDDEEDQTPTLPKRVKAPSDLRVLQKEANVFAVANAQTATDSNKKGIPKGAIPAAKPGEEYEEVIDPVTGKKTLVKKKKKKKKEEKKDTTAAAVMPTMPDLSALLDPNADLGAAVNMAAGAPEGTPLPTPAPSANVSGGTANSVNSLQQWESLLLTTPNRAETLIFIQDFQNNLVSSQIYYTIVKAMIADSRADMKQLGLLCAGTVQSATSFTILADLDKSDTTGTLKPTADTYLAKYATINDLGILRSVLLTSDTHAQMFAAQELDTVATANASSASQFQPFVTILQGLISSSDSTLASQAQTTLSALNSEIAASGGSTAVQAASAQQP